MSLVKLGVRRVGPGFGPHLSWIGGPLALGKLALTQVIQHVVVQLPRGALVRSGSNPREKHLEHIPYLREAEDTL